VPDPPDTGITIVYDGECPLCRGFVRRLRLRDAAGAVRLIDARQSPALVRELAQRGFSLEEGLVVQVGPQLHHGASAIHVLASMSTRIGWLNRLHYRVFRSRRLSALVYPWLVFGRRILLRLLGRRLLKADLGPPGGAAPNVVSLEDVREDTHQGPVLRNPLRRDPRDGCR
jgi:predicted DCC family thiol-disulfide oxidoreductase YuxK